MEGMEEEEARRRVIIIGAGPAGLATAACLSVLSIPFRVLEREDCTASLWRRRAYNRLKLHLAKQFCELPHMPHPADTPTYMPKDTFVRYLDDYAVKFGIRPNFGAVVESAVCREEDGKWAVTARNATTGEACEHVGGFLVVATGENSEPHVPKVDGLEEFAGEVLHSSEYKCGEKYGGKKVLVVGSGNSGMEIAYDLSNYGALTSICVRSEFHVVSKEMIHLGMFLLKYKMPLLLVDKIMLLLCNIKYGDLSKFGIVRPKAGPFLLKATAGKTPAIDVGTVSKIKAGEIQVLPGISIIEGNCLRFTNGVTHYFDTILFATGYTSAANRWLKDKKHFLNEKGLPSRRFPNHWKGENGLYSAGLASRGLEGIAGDARLIANDICMTLRNTRAMEKPGYYTLRKEGEKMNFAPKVE
ncbi:putative indole-3-pyruvate monooxygenase YUCCA10 [Platanthera guangdongensis]|uniref:Flavin-containing monooxygenase n=1 Tax=Platanthera guangdongensis TaxID=2320717 RepID=A0ABR2N0T0_9ASPA